MADAAENYRKIRASVDEAAISAGRLPEDIELMAVTKFVDTDRIKAAIEAGAVSCGENRVQEYLQKADFFREKGVTCDIIGRLQLNKVKYVAGEVRYIQSVDRLPLAEEISRICMKKGKTQDVLIEVNIGDEEQKGGVPVSELDDLLLKISVLPCIFVKGLMCIPPELCEEEAEKYFVKMNELFRRISDREIKGVEMKELSMGMSGDYKAAVRHGATIVRVGTGIFGPRY